MISADIGVETSALILERLRERIKLKGLKTQDEVKVALKEIIADILRPCEASLNFDEHKPLVIMMCGVNGAGKTTTIGKLAKHFAQLNKKFFWQPQIRLERPQRSNWLSGVIAIKSR